MGSASLGHRLSKPVRNWEHDEPDADLAYLEEADYLDLLPESEEAEGPTGRGPDAKAEHELRKWGSLWRPRQLAVDVSGPDQELTTLQWPDLGAEPALPPITTEEIRRAASSFKRRAGLGPDQFHPRWIALLSDEALEALAAFYVACEAEGRWP